MENNEKGNKIYNDYPKYSPSLTSNGLFSQKKEMLNYLKNDSNKENELYSINYKNNNSSNRKNLNGAKSPLKSNKQNANNNKISSNMTPLYNNFYDSKAQNYSSPKANKNKYSNKNMKPKTKKAISSINSFRKNHKKKTLILDLDETLVHSGFHPFERKSDFIFNINIDGKEHTIYALKRPYVEEFLSEISLYYEVIIFTASIPEYASPLIDLLDKNKITSKRLYREHCLLDNGLYLKDLKSIGKNMKDMIIIDNNPISYILNQDNGIPILTWYEDLEDKELINLIPLLKYLSIVDDVRPIINKIVDQKSNTINFALVENMIKNKISKNKNLKNMIYEANEKYNSKKNISNLNKKENNKKYNKNDYNNYEAEKSNIEADMNEISNKYRNYLDNNLYKYTNIHDSLSNMSYNEIQNEGNIKNSKNTQINNFFNKYEERYNTINQPKEYQNNRGQNKEISSYKNRNFSLNNQYNTQINENLNKIKEKGKFKQSIKNSNKFITPNISVQRRANSYFNNEKNVIRNFYPFEKKEKNNKNKTGINPTEIQNESNINNINKNSINNYNSYSNNYRNNFNNNKSNTKVKKRKLNSLSNLASNNSILSESKENNDYNNNYINTYQQNLLKNKTRSNSYNNTGSNIPLNNYNNTNFQKYSNNNNNVPYSYTMELNYDNDIKNNIRNNSFSNLNYRNNSNYNTISNYKYNNLNLDENELKIISNKQDINYLYTNPTMSENNKNQKTNIHPMNNTFRQNYTNKNVTININDNYKQFLDSKKNSIYNDQKFNKTVYNNNSSYFTNKEINDIKNIKLNNNYKSNDYRNQRTNTDVAQNKYKDFILENNNNNNESNGPNQYKNVFRNYKRNTFILNNYQNMLYNHERQNIKSYNNTNNYNNDKYYQFLQQLNKENNFYSNKNNIDSYPDNNYNEISKIDGKYANNYNFKNLDIENEVIEQDTILKKMNKSSSNFYPKKTYSSYFSINDNSENMNFDYKKYNNYYEGRNLSHNNKLIKSKFLSNYDTNYDAT